MGIRPTDFNRHFAWVKTLGVDPLLYIYSFTCPAATNIPYLAKAWFKFDQIKYCKHLGKNQSELIPFLEVQKPWVNLKKKNSPPLPSGASWKGEILKRDQKGSPWSIRTT